tara:strand:+ start:94888 stop:95742 length:855 start_codon:yes stop_codon:yes gene_type:complete
MKGLLRTLVALSFYPVSLIANYLRPGVRILMFHRVDSLPHFDQLTVSPGRFSQQMDILARSYRVISLTQALTELANGKVKRNTVVITFDDGYLDNLTHALPMMEERGLPASVFVTTEFASGAQQHPRYGSSARLHMNWGEVKEWLRFPGNEVGAHSRSHPYLQRVSDEQCREEIAGCMGDMAAAGVAHNGIFCYPSGDVTEREAHRVRASGYVAAVTVAPGVNFPTTNRFWLHRTEVTDRDTPLLFRLKLAGCFDLIHGVLHVRRTRQFSKQSQVEKELKGVNH